MNRTLGYTVAVTSLSFASTQLDATITNIALVRIGETIHSSMSDLQWIVDAYTLAFASFLLISGDIGDKFGSRRVFMSGIVLFLVASVICFFAQTAIQLIALRAIQGAGAALAFPNSHALINHACSEQLGARTRAFGLWNAVGSLATAVGPVMGGMLVESLGWRSIFLINIPICVAIIYFTFTHVKETTYDPKVKSIDIKGQLISLSSIFLLIWGIIGAGATDGNSALSALGLCASGGAFYAFIKFERRTTRPLLETDLFVRPSFCAMIVLGFLNNVAFYGLLFVLGFYLQKMLNLTIQQASFVFVPLVASSLSNLLGGGLSTYRGARYPMIGGFLLGAAGFGWFFAIIGDRHYFSMLPPLVLIALGLGLVVPQITVALLSSVDKSRSGIASAVLATARQIGCAVGVAVYGSIISGHFMSPLLGIQLCFVGGVVLCVAASIISAIWAT